MNRRMLSPMQQMSPEEIFARHYEWLLKWAEYFTRGQQEQAEDLVHELFIQFLRTAPELDSDESAKPYLYRSLHNLFLANLSRNSRVRQHQLSIYDYDSFRIGLSSIDRSSLLSVREDLWNICKYACERKSTLRAASYFILRFFLEYRPSEIMALAGTTRAAFDKNIQLMRGEVCSYFGSHGSVVVMRRPIVEDTFPCIPSGQEAGDLFQQIFRFIHSRNQGSCLQADDVRELYSLGKPLETSVVAHLVSCESCRDLCMQHIGGGANHPGALSNTQEINGNHRNLPPVRRAGGYNLARLRQKYCENFEHRPAYLYLSIASKTEASQRITSVSSEFSASIPGVNLPIFVDITSEQGIRFLSILLNEDYDRFPDDTRASTELSDGRFLSVEASCSGGSLRVRATYFDPIADADSADIYSSSPPMIPRQNLTTISQRVSRFARVKVYVQNLLSKIYWPPFAAGTAALLLLLLVLVPGLHRSYTRRQALSALMQVHQAEQMLVEAHDVHRVGIFQGETSSAKTPDRRIEVWQSSSPAHMAARLYAADGRLEATALNDSIEPGDLRPEELWHAGFDTAVAEQVIRDGRVETAELPHNTLRITARSGEGHLIRGVVEAVVVLDRTTDRVVEQAYVIRKADHDYHLRLVETRFEVLPRGKFKPEIFQLDPTISKATDKAHATIHSFGATTEAESVASRQIAVLWALHLAGSDPGEQLEVQRRGDGISISGVVTTVQRRDFIKQLLLSSCAICELHIQTTDSHHRFSRKNVAGRIDLQTADVTLASSDAEELLRSAFGGKGYDATQLRQYATEHTLELGDLAAGLVRSTDALEKSASCCTSSEFRMISLEKQRLWMQLLTAQLDQVDKGLSSLQGKMDVLNIAAGLPSNPIQYTTTPASNDGVAQIRSLHRLAIAIQLSLQDFGTGKHGAEQTATSHWRQLFVQTDELRQQLDTARSLIHSSR